MPMQKRPIYLDLLKITMPITAIVSILHRISGVVLFLLAPWMFYMLHRSLVDAPSFADVHTCFQSCTYKIIIWAFSAAFIYHMCAGVRHMIMDLGYGESFQTGRITAIIMLGISAVLIIGFGVWIW
jgi:succinate dehydrogenase / fumarate reductase cytochrome b subunit